jgi:hypothetical protein
MRTDRTIAILLLTLGLCVGCNSKGTVNVKAHLTLDGQPLEGASVTLIGIEGTNLRPATGVSDAAGNVTFTSFEPNDGVLPGEYKVLVSKAPKSLQEEYKRMDPNDPEDMARLQAHERSANVPYTPSLLPKAYLNASETPLTMKVPPENQPVEFALDSSLGKHKP